MDDYNSLKERYWEIFKECYQFALENNLMTILQFLLTAPLTAKQFEELNYYFSYYNCNENSRNYAQQVLKYLKRLSEYAWQVHLRTITKDDKDKLGPKSVNISAFFADVFTVKDQKNEQFFVQFLTRDCHKTAGLLFWTHR